MKMENKAQSLHLAWLKNGIWALAFAGLYSIILVVLRTPGLAFLLEDKSLFKSSLIIHVDLSVLVWLLSIAAVVWSYGSKEVYFEKIFAKLSFGGMVLMAISPLIGSSYPVMNNYVPILENVWFIVGLCLFGTSLFCFAVLVLMSSWQEFASSTKNEDSLLSIVKITSTLMYIGVWVCFVLSFKQVDYLTTIVPMDLEYYYELLFWSGGHLLQFIYTQIAMFVWLILAERWRGNSLGCTKLFASVFGLNFLVSVAIFYGHFAYQMPDFEFKEYFTNHMKYGGGIAPTLFVLLLLITLCRNARNEGQGYIPTAFLTSTFLFFVGGLIGTLISGVNVSIPAHYHGSIVGISIAFMGFAYVFCFKGEQVSKWPTVQLCLITIGQLLHISGLALSGGYGIMRKNPDDIIPTSAKIYMGMMGGGGLIAIIGGLMFVYICGKRLYLR